MNFLLLFLPFLVFLFTLYKITKDDYVFIRKNISVEQVFDIAFLTTLIILFFSRFFYFLLHPVGDNYYITYFSFIQKGGFSLVGAVVAGAATLYLIAKYKKIPLGRLFDFFSLSFLIALPFGFLSQSIFLKHINLYISLLNIISYAIVGILFLKFIYPKILNRSLKEGYITVLLLIFFSVMSLLNSLIATFKNFDFVSIDKICLYILFLVSIVLLIKLERKRLFKTRRSVA